MPGRTIRFSDPVESSMGQQQSREEIRRPVSRADSLNERIAGLVSSNALPPATPPDPTLFDRLKTRYHDTRNFRRQIGRDLRHVNQQVANFQQVPRGRRFYLRIQHSTYSQREEELERRMMIAEEYMAQNPGIHADNMRDSSDDEEEIFGRDPPQMLDYGSDSDGPEDITFHIGQGEDAARMMLPMELVEAHGGNIFRNRRARRAAHSSRGRRDPRDAGFDGEEIIDDSLPSYDDAVGRLADRYSRTMGILSGDDFQHVLETGIAVNEQLFNTFDPLARAEYAGEIEDVDEYGEIQEDENDMALDEADYDLDPDSQEDESEESSENEVAERSPQHVESTLDTNPDRPHNWQAFHQYFMYSCRGDITAVTGELQATFDFEPEIKREWVGKQLNEIGNIRKQLEYLERWLPGESGTIDRVQAREQLASLDCSVPDIYDGVNTGQIFDIDPTSDAYTEPVRPADLPPTWTPIIDATLLTVLPNISTMETFWLDNTGILQEMWGSGVGSQRKKDAMGIRCGQLRYLKFPEEDLAAGREGSEIDG